MTQTQWIVQRLRRQWPNVEIAVEQIHTTGDRVTNVPLSQIGGDGVFVTEIERALTERRIDLAVHSLKDLPTIQPEGLRIVVAGPREDVRDIFVSQQDISLLDGKLYVAGQSTPLGSGFRIGTSSLRRTAQIREFAPDVEISSIRGNVDTRLRKLEAGEYDGIVLASAGVHRLEMQERLRGRLTYFPIDMVMPAPGQGAIALECRDEPEILALLAPIQDLAVQAATSAERMFMRRLGAGCYLPVAAYGEVVAERDDKVMSLQTLVISLDGTHTIRLQQQMSWTDSSTIADAEQLGIRVAEQALAQGAQEIIQSLDVPRK
jgi:hydroxymethylbilane synthase